jgi:CDP-diglyceride synthetase
MRTAIAILIGVVLVLAFRTVTASINKRRAAPATDGARWFVWLWLAATVVDFLVGVNAGHGVVLELGVHALIFAVPAALAWYLRSRRTATQGATDIRPSSGE